MTFRLELLDELLKDYKNPEDLLGKDGLLKQLSAALVERCLNAEMDYHLEEERNEPNPIQAHPAIGAMDTVKRPLRASLAKPKLRFRATATARLSQSSLRSTRRALTGLTARSYLCMPVA
jgi:transposase-like protein